MNRRDFLATSGATALSGSLATLARFDRIAGAAPEPAALREVAHRAPADYTLRIAPLKLELAPGKALARARDSRRR